MKKRGLLTVLFFMSLLLTMSLTTAATQVNINSNEGIEISYPKFETVKKNIHFNLTVRAFNISSGLEVKTAACNLQLYNQSGDIVFNQNLTYFNNLGYNLYIQKGNFSNEGTYSFNIYCADPSGIGGFASGLFFITKTGVQLDTSEALIYLLLSFGVIFIFLLCLYLLIITPYKNRVDEKGAVIKITKLKYVKLALFMLTYQMFIWVLNIFIGVSDNYVNLTMFYGFVSFLFIILTNLAFPVGIFIIILMFFEIIRDANIQGAIDKLGSHNP